MMNKTSTDLHIPPPYTITEEKRSTKPEKKLPLVIKRPWR